MLNWLLRYQPVMRILDDLKASDVVDVGAGSHGLSLYWPGHVVQVDRGFGPVPEERAGTASLVAASFDALPFEDGAFDVAVSVDVVEHLPAEIRAKCMSELFRVSRRAVVMAYPIGKVAERADKAFTARYRIARQPIPDWMLEHLAQEVYPTEDLFYSALPPRWHVTRREREHNVWLQLVIGLAETTRLERVTERIEKWGRTHRLPQPLKVGGSYRWYFLAEREAS